MLMIQQEYTAPVGHHPQLNPLLWDQNHLRAPVQQALMRIAQDFKNFCDVPFRVVDVVISGGNANYTSSSDIDLHLVADFASVDCDREVAELFDTKRLLYRRDFDLKIAGIPVELYVEDSAHPAVSAGRYSLLKHQWIHQPSADIPAYDEVAVRAWADRWEYILRQAIHTGDLEICRRCLSLLRQYRRWGLATPAGEFSVANLVYKSLRNAQVIEAITLFVNRLHSQTLSIQ